MNFSFEIEKRSEEKLSDGQNSLARAGIIHTPHGDIKTPAFIAVGTKATVKSLTPEDVRDLVGSQVVLANTYHLYLQPGPSIVKKHGGFASMMNFKNEKGELMPTFTDSGGFQVFSLGQALGHGVSKIATSEEISAREVKEETSNHEKLAVIDDDGVTFKSVIDGSEHRFTPEISMQIQHDLGADIFFAFDECTSPLAPKEYQLEAINRTYEWAKRSLAEHKRLGVSESTGEMQALFGVIQGGSYEDLRKESARTLSEMDFDGYGIGGSFTKEDMNKAVRWVNEILPENKPRHLLGIGEPLDMLLAIENGVDTFDCVSPTRIARNGSVYTKDGRINLLNAKYKEDMSPLSEDESWYTHKYTKSYMCHLFRSDEMLAATLASIHNLKFLTTLCEDARSAIIDGTYKTFKEEFIKRYYKK
ncbi:MAG: queuine tRNA-ribosyltransferase [Candidatus Nomurabacteria bacterium]|nr:queuine tRNA-ribosyltransferase [Candidatus Nomurabacteria bacterium]